MKLVKRVLNIEIETCEVCAGQVKIITYIQNPAVIERISAHLNGKAPSAGTGCLLMAASYRHRLDSSVESRETLIFVAASFEDRKFFYWLADRNRAESDEKPLRRGE